MIWYTKTGRRYKGPTHKMKNGETHSGSKHSSKSQKLYKTRRTKR